MIAGKDINWDLLNYHYYLPFELLAGRLEQDFFAASAQSYLNPVGYLPFYLMVSSGWHSVIASIVLALAHSVSIGLLYLLAWRLFAHLPPRERVLLCCLAALLGAATPVFWATVGGSFLDPLLVAPMLGGLLLLLDPGPRPAGRAALAGALFGAAAALKYSNAIYAFAALPLAIAVPGLSGRARLRSALAYAAGGMTALAVLAGPWLALMLQEFGNPVFPLMNGWFQSAHAPAANLVGERFTAKDFADAVTLPFRMMLLDRSLYAEIFAPDIRVAALLAGAIAVPVLGARRRMASVLRGPDWRVFAFCAVASVLWVASSANARYGMVLLLLAGVCLARITERVLPAGAARVALALMLGVQVAMSIVASPSRWFIAAPWSRHWLPYEAPERARREPALYLTVEVLPMAAVAPFVHPASSFVNFRGQHSLPADSPRLAELLERHRGHVRTLGRGLALVNGVPPQDQLEAYDATLLRIGYRVDPRDCFTIPWRPQDEDPLSMAANWLAGTLPPHEPLSVASCALRTAARDPADVARERRASALFDRMERTCPQLFRGQTAVTEPLGGGWSRYYPGLDARLEAYAERAILNRHRAGNFVDLGLLADWEREVSSATAACGGKAPTKR